MRKHEKNSYSGVVVVGSGWVVVRSYMVWCGVVDACMMSVPDQSIYLRAKKKRGRGR